MLEILGGERPYLAILIRQRSALGIRALLSFVGLSEADDPADLPALHVADRVKPPRCIEGNQALLART